jgi:hypothetical protein
MNRVRQVRKASSPNAATSDMAAESSPLLRTTAPTTLRLSDLARGIVDGPEDPLTRLEPVTRGRLTDHRV